MPSLPTELLITPAFGPISGAACLPGSKSLTNRLLVLAALAAPEAHADHSVIQQALHAEDTEWMVAALRQLGIPISAAWEAGRLIVPAVPRQRWVSEADFYCGNSGTTLRFLATMLALGRGRYRLDGSPRMRQRPIAELLDALRQLGVQADSEAGTGCPPVLLQTQGIVGDQARLSGARSSQFLSALLMAAPLADTAEVVLEVTPPLVSMPYVDMTLACVRAAGGVVHEERPPDPEGGRWRVPGRQHYRPRSWEVEPDASAASYFLAAAAITGGRVTIPGLNQHSWQGDVRFAQVLAAMGCTVEDNPLAVTGRTLTGIEVDMNAISDTVMTLAVVALFAQGPTRIRNVAHVRHKESDRLAALAAELRKTGAAVHEWPDGLEIHPAPLHGARLETYNDHRLAMAFALIGLRVPGIIVVDPGCVAKTFPGYFAELERLRASGSG
jgi:3-phosphoshikimate 1-carboxyvinyltransferase